MFFLEQLFWYRNHACTTTAKRNRGGLEDPLLWGTRLLHVDGGGRRWGSKTWPCRQCARCTFQYTPCQQYTLRIEIQWKIPCRTSHTLSVSRNIFGSRLYGSDTARIMRLQLPTVVKHDFISNQLLFYCWLTQQALQSVSFSFNPVICFFQWNIMCK